MAGGDGDEMSQRKESIKVLSWNTTSVNTVLIAVNCIEVSDSECFCIRMDVSCICFSQKQKQPGVALLLPSLIFNTYKHLLGDATLSACMIIPPGVGPAAEADWTLQAGAAQLYCTYCNTKKNMCNCISREWIEIILHFSKPPNCYYSLTPH